MASPAVEAAAAPSPSADSDLARPIYPYHLSIEELPTSALGGSRTLRSMDDLLRSIYGGVGGGDQEEEEEEEEEVKGMRGAKVEGVAMAAAAAAAAEVEEDEAYGHVTLEDFLARAGAVREEDIRVLSGAAVGIGAPTVGLPAPGNPALGFGDNSAVEGGRGGRRRKRPVLDPVDKATMQRQKRMIKNRESAARSRERKQAYTLELESLVAQLEEENARLLREQEEFKKRRLKEIKENVIPATEKKKPARPSPLRRTQSSKW